MTVQVDGFTIQNSRVTVEEGVSNLLYEFIEKSRDRMECGVGTETLIKALGSIRDLIGKKQKVKFTFNGTSKVTLSGTSEDETRTKATVLQFDINRTAIPCGEVILDLDMFLGSLREFNDREIKLVMSPDEEPVHARGVSRNVFKCRFIHTWDGKE